MLGKGAVGVHCLAEYRDVFLGPCLVDVSGSARGRWVHASSALRLRPLENYVSLCIIPSKASSPTGSAVHGSLLRSDSWVHSEDPCRDFLCKYTQSMHVYRCKRTWATLHSPQSRLP